MNVRNSAYWGRKKKQRLHCFLFLLVYEVMAFISVTTNLNTASLHETARDLGTIAGYILSKVIVVFEEELKPLWDYFRCLGPIGDFI